MPEGDASIRLFDAMAEQVRGEAAKNKTMSQRKALLGVAAGLEIAACVLREQAGKGEEATAQEAAQLLARFRSTRYAYLLEKEPGPFRRRPPDLMVKKVVKGKAEKERQDARKRRR